MWLILFFYAYWLAYLIDQISFVVIIFSMKIKRATHLMMTLLREKIYLSIWIQIIVDQPGCTGAQWSNLIGKGGNNHLFG